MHFTSFINGTFFNLLTIFSRVPDIVDHLLGNSNPTPSANKENPQTLIYQGLAGFRRTCYYYSLFSPYAESLSRFFNACKKHKLQIRFFHLTIFFLFSEH